MVGTTRGSIFSGEQIRDMKADLDLCRRGPGYVPGRWNVSAANRRPEVVSSLRPDIRVRDITLRVSEQVSGIALSHQQRLRLLAALVRAGVPEIETSAFRRGHTLAEMRDEVETAKAINPSCELTYGGANTAEDFALAAAAGYDTVRIWTGPFLGRALASYAGAVYHRSWQGRDWTDLRFPAEAKQVVERARRLVDLGVQKGLKVGGSILLLTYATDDFVASYSRAVSDAGATDVMLGDHSSGVAPEAFAHFVKIADEVSSADCSVSVHTHDMFGLADACGLASALQGAKAVEVSIDGFTEGPAQADLAHVAGSLAILYGADTGVDLSQMVPLARLAESMLKRDRPGDWPLTGTRVFDYGDGADEYAQELKVDPLIHMSLDPAVVGNERHLRIAVTSGPFTMWDKLEELGIHVPKELVEPILSACKQRMLENTEVLSDNAIREISAHVVSSLSRATASS
jgi:isopropylmalate/homocitrate/citramalate synthase